VGTSLRDLRERVYTVGRSDIRLNDHQDSEVSPTYTPMFS
jgi:hypothetical protein